MREIKFRGKNEKGWYYGLLTFMFNSYAISHVEDENTVDLIDRETIGQYTGLKGKNGVEIYEGDIIVGRQFMTTAPSTPFEIKGTVKYSERNTMFYLDSPGQRHDAFIHSVGASIYTFEVIGNIYENPELMEEK